MKIYPCELRDANAFIAMHHRHHKPVQGHRFSICVVDGNSQNSHIHQSPQICGVAVVGRPVARMTCQRTIVEVTRLCTDGTKNACSMLYSAAARIAKEMGYSMIQTFILKEESGISLKAAGWHLHSISDGGDWNTPSRGGRRTDQPMQAKSKWVKNLRTPT